MEVYSIVAIMKSFLFGAPSLDRLPGNVLYSVKLGRTEYSHPFFEADKHVRVLRGLQYVE